MMLWYGSEMSGWAYAGMAIGMVLFWTALIVGGVVLLQQVFGTNNAESIRMRDTDLARHFGREVRAWRNRRKPVPAADRNIAGGQRFPPR